jgi:hypothetical protein
MMPEIGCGLINIELLNSYIYDDVDHDVDDGDDKNNDSRDWVDRVIKIIIISR